ncbi:hypothetical protein [Litorisediminicola beolgyonensis]|uniref:PepSY domain-containing protein n=1 Tax=Litorisediminicola beolgyonensis TaxID=1173614 RepID=A0ABW3ZM71_9RHOB
MPRWVWFLPVGLLVVLAALLGWRQGWHVATLTETDVIERAAARYLSDREAAGTADGARAEQCRARPAPGNSGAWLVVICGPEPHDPDRHYTYYHRRDGALMRVVGPEGV